jgi:hypothetical protein
MNRRAVYYKSHYPIYAYYLASQDLVSIKNFSSVYAGINKDAPYCVIIHCGKCVNLHKTLGGGFIDNTLTSYKGDVLIYPTLKLTTSNQAGIGFANSLD